MKCLCVNGDVHETDGWTFMDGSDVLWGLSWVQIDKYNFRQFSLCLLSFMIVGLGEGLLLP